MGNANHKTGDQRVHTDPRPQPCERQVLRSARIGLRFPARPIRLAPQYLLGTLGAYWALERTFAILGT